ncbi:MAG: hypothetical protein A2143_08155 [Gallionellales bacterium RBG_16_57_15]|nr:MAG: hypothetical protein A2143_08155 [Gallionellales bacterium RBG_16_57_15]
MSLYRDEKSPVWYVSITIKGRRVRRSTGTAIKQEAQQIHDQLKADLWKQKHTGITWKNACADWLNHQPRNESDRYRLRALIASIPDVPLNELTATLIQPHLTGAPATWNRTANLVTAILNFAKRRGHLDTVPIIERKKIPPARIRWLTHEEWLRLDAQLPPHLRSLARFSLATGLRQGNATHLEWSQVDMRRKVAWIHADQAKAGKPIGIPLSDAAMEVLNGQIGQHDAWVFPYKDKPLGQIKTAWGKALKRAGVKNFRWHDLRHTWATWHIQAGTPLEVLQKLGGWASYSMVLRYAHLAPDHLAGYANNAKPYISGIIRSETA